MFEGVECDESVECVSVKIHLNTKQSISVLVQEREQCVQRVWRVTV